MITFDKPILACSLLKPSDPHTDFFIYERMKTLQYPVLATLKKDGIRAIKLGDLASRTLKKIPNLSISERSKKLPYGFDMELWSHSLTYDQIESIVMSKVHKDSHLIQFHVLDWWTPIYIPYIERIHCAAHESNSINDCFVEEPIVCNSAGELLEQFLRIESEEGEGICFRTPYSPYKQGRSTLREQYLIKLTRYVWEDATIIGFEEQMLNTNPEKINFVGLTKRPSFKAGMVGKGILGAFLVKDANGLEFRIGTGVGLTDKKRAEIWDKREEWLNTTIVYKSKGHGVKIKPRCPIFVGKRNEIDIV
jgi:DNA ligase-1